MIDKLNISIQNKNTKKITYTLYLDKLWLDNVHWEKEEFNHKDKITYFESGRGNWVKVYYDSKDNMVYCEDGNVKHNR